ncbi:hypothetical protein RSSM_04314 [Rhodopirellula sallentina SM41]|uniref:Uncharacterized protein n=1 Tax=Rhodopirellula sallentina SM41 TaxID=1263870 RepID=M5UE30_9BACT|nr:hypothetical protein RSSM_04314 [Rhodopirellula sallentina SM41]
MIEPKGDGFDMCGHSFIRAVRKIEPFAINRGGTSLTQRDARAATCNEP